MELYWRLNCVLMLNLIIRLFCVIIWNKTIWLTPCIDQSAGTVEYNDCTSAEEYPSPNECPAYDTKQSDGEVPVILEPWVIRSHPSLPLLPGLPWPGVVAPDRALSVG